MPIGKRLYLSFGAVLAMVIVLFLVNIIAVQREHAPRPPVPWRSNCPRPPIGSVLR